MKHAKRLMLMLAMLVITAGPAVAKDYDLHQAVLDNNFGWVDKLLRKGLFIDEIGSRKYGYGSALHLAVREGHLNIAKLLLDRGAQVDVLDPDDLTPLHNAAWNGNLEMTKLLLEAGADIEASTYDGDTPLKLARNNNQAQVADFIQAKLQSSVTSEAKIESQTASDPGAIDISGVYISEITSNSPYARDRNHFKKKYQRLRIVIKQDGNSFTAREDKYKTKIRGTIEGNVIKFYVDSGGGGASSSWDAKGEWKVSADGTRLQGFWISVGGPGFVSGKWNLTKIESQTASDPGAIDISGTYISEITVSGNAIPTKIFMKKINRKEITLEQTGNAISWVDSPKNLKINGTREGNTINFNIVWTKDDIYGTWEINADATEIVGKWSSDGWGGASGKWNLKRLQ